MSLYGGENWKSVETNIALSSEFITKMKINYIWKKKLSLGGLKAFKLENWAIEAGNLNAS